MSLLSLMQNVARTVLSKYGSVATFVRNPAPSYTPATSTVTQAASTSISTKAILLSNSTNRRPEGSGSESLLEILVDPDISSNIDLGDRVTFQAASFAIERIDPQFVQDSIVFCRVVLRR